MFGSTFKYWSNREIPTGALDVVGEGSDITADLLTKATRTSGWSKLRWRNICDNQLATGINEKNS